MPTTCKINYVSMRFIYIFIFILISFFLNIFLIKRLIFLSVSQSFFKKKTKSGQNGALNFHNIKFYLIWNTPFLTVYVVLHILFNMQKLTCFQLQLICIAFFGRCCQTGIDANILQFLAPILDLLRINLPSLNCPVANLGRERWG